MAGAVLAVLSEKDEHCRVLHAGVALARELSTRLTVVGIPLRPPIGVSCAPIVLGASYPSLRRESVERIDRQCRELTQNVPSDVPIEYRVISGRPGRVVDSLLVAGRFGAVVVHDDWMRGPLMRRAVGRWRQQGMSVYAA